MFCEERGGLSRTDTNFVATVNKTDTSSGVFFKIVSMRLYVFGNLLFLRYVSKN